MVGTNTATYTIRCRYDNSTIQFVLESRNQKGRRNIQPFGNGSNQNQPSLLATAAPDGRNSEFHLNDFGVKICPEKGGAKK
jgi:hypothetical protein